MTQYRTKLAMERVRAWMEECRRLGLSMPEEAIRRARQAAEDTEAELEAKDDAPPPMEGPR